MSRTDTSSSRTKLVRFNAAALVDARGIHAAPASLLVEWADRSGSIFPARVLALGSPANVDAHPAARAPRLLTITRPRAVLIPGLVNAHTHLDLTHIGPQPHDPSRGFMPWVDMVRSRRETEPDRIAASVERGVELSLAAGTVAVGDIAGAVRGRISFDATQALRRSPLVGVSWLEFFGIGAGASRSQQMLESLRPELMALAAGVHRIRLGLQPHAPNTVARAVYTQAVAIARSLGGPAPLTTHLAETPEEREFIGRGTGPQRELLEALGLWNDTILADIGRGQHPVEYLRPVLAESPFTVAHVNDAPDEAIQALAATKTTVVYCPRASRYFGAERHFGPHRYREMLESGVRVALGTDSVVNLPPEAGRPPSEPGGRGMSILDEMRFLHTRDQTSVLQLLAMGTVNGARALGLPLAAFGFAADEPLAGLAGVTAADAMVTGDPLETVVSPSSTTELLFASNFSDLADIQK